MGKSRKHQTPNTPPQASAKEHKVLRAFLATGIQRLVVLRKFAKKIFVSSISLGILGILISIWLSNNSDAKNKGIHRQTSEQIDVQFHQIIDSLSLKTLCLEQQLSEIKTIVIKSNLGIHKAWADSLFLVAETLLPISLKDAESIYTKVLSTAPCAEAYCNRAIVRRFLFEPAKALEDYAKALELAPESVMILRNRGLCFVSIGDYDSAEKDYRKAIALKPDFIEPYRCLSILYCKKGLCWKALDILNNPHINESLNLMYLATRCEVNIKCGNYTSANEDAHIMLQQWPDGPPGHLYLGELCDLSGNYTGSIAEYSRGLQNIDNKNFWALFLYQRRALAYYRMELYDESINDYHNLLEISPSNSTPLRMIGDIYLIRNQYEKALEYFDKALTVNSKETCLDERLEICILTQKEDSALYHCQHLAKLYPQEPEIPFWTAVLQRTRGNKAECMKLIRKTVELNPEYVKAYLLMANVYCSECSWREAIEVYSDKVLQLLPNCAAVYYNRGICYANLHDLTRAFIDFSVAIDLNPEDPLPYVNRAICCQKIGDHELAKQDLETALKLDPSIQQYMQGFIGINPCIDFKTIRNIPKNRRTINIIKNIQQ